MYNRFICSNRERLRRLFISSNEIFAPRRRLQARSRQQQSSASFWKTIERYIALVKIQNRPEPAKPDDHTSSNPYHPRLAPVTLHIFHHQLSRRNTPIYSIVLGASVLLLFSHVNDMILQRSAFLRSQLILFHKRRKHELQKPSKGLLRESMGIS